MKKRQKRVLSSLLAATFLLILGNIYQSTASGPLQEFDVKGKPSFGNGPLKFVLFEDLLCYNCKKFAENVFPQIVSNYLDPGRAELSFIPVAFTEESKVFANAAISIYHLNPSRLIPFLILLPKIKGDSSEDILEIAKRTGGIPLETLKKNMEHKEYYPEIDQNLSWAKSIVGPDFGTPMLFVDGARASTSSFEELSRQIERMELK